MVSDAFGLTKRLRVAVLSLVDLIGPKANIMPKSWT